MTSTHAPPRQPHRLRSRDAARADLTLAPAPPFGRELVRRARLADRLSGAHDALLAVIVAPPGYGKSTLLYEWADRDPRVFVWLRLDDPRSASTAEAVARAFEDIRRGIAGSCS